MHRYREFGLVSDEDETFRRAFRDSFKRTGLSFRRFLEALEWYRDRAGQVASEDELINGFSEFAAGRGWSAREREGALDAYRAIRDSGPQAVMQEAPAVEQDRATIAQGDDLLRRDPSRYWSDMEFQDAVFEARERLAQSADATPSESFAPRTEADRRRVAEIEAMLHDPSGAGQRRYWNDVSVRDDYVQALARLADQEAQSATSKASASGENVPSRTRSTPAVDAPAVETAAAIGPDPR